MSFAEYFGLCMLKLQVLGFEPQPPPFFPTKKAQKLPKKSKKEGRGFDPKTSHSQTIERKPTFVKNLKKKIKKSKIKFLNFWEVDYPSTTKAPPPPSRPASSLHLPSRA
jgi:hypothetical protein